jgi:hypothetical protein
VPFLYKEYVAKGLLLAAKMLRPALIAISQFVDLIRLVIDGLDKIKIIEYKLVLQDLKQLTKLRGKTYKLLIAN